MYRYSHEDALDEGNLIESPGPHDLTRNQRLMRNNRAFVRRSTLITGRCFQVLRTLSWW